MTMKWHQAKRPKKLGGGEYKGIRYREHPSRKKDAVNLDRYYTLSYWWNGKSHSEAVGWATEGVSAQRAYELLMDLKENQKNRTPPFTLRELREENWRDAQQAASKNVTLDEYWPVFFEHCKLHIKKSSWEKEESNFKVWISPCLGHFRLADIKLPQWDILVKALTDAGRAERTKEYVTGTLRRILKFAYERQVIDETPPTGRRVGVTGPGQSNRRRRIIQPHEEQALLEKLRSLDISAWRLVRFAFLTGCRAGEAFKLCWRDVDFVSGTLVFVDTKNGDSRRIPMSRALQELLKSIPQGRLDEPVFLAKRGLPYKESPSSYRLVVNDILRLNEGRPDLERITFHSIRHTVATRLAQQLNPRDLMDLMGWRTVEMAMRYVKGDMEIQRNAFESLAESRSMGNVVSLR